MSTQVVPDQITVEVTDVGGIRETTVDLTNGVNALVGENATNRSSFLRALISGMGSSVGTVRRGAAEGQVTIEMDGETYTRTVTRDEERDVWSGSGVLTDTERVRSAELFAFLLEDNEIRRTVERGGDLYDLLLQPVDRDALADREAELRERRDALRDELDTIQEAKRTLVGLEEDRNRLETEIEDLTAERDRLAERVDELEKRVSDPGEESDVVAELEEELTEAESTLRSRKRTLRSIENSLSAARASLDELAVPDIDIDETRAERDDLAGELRELRNRRSRVRTNIDKLDAVIDAHDELRSGDLAGEAIVGSLGLDADEIPDGPLANGPSPGEGIDIESSLAGDETDERTQCSVCGSTVGLDRLERLRVQLSSLRTQLEGKRDELDEEIERVESRRSVVVDQIGRYESKRARRETLEAEIETDQRRLESKREEVEEARGTVEEKKEALAEIEEEMAERGGDEVEELTDAKADLRETRSTLGDKREELDAVTDRIETNAETVDAQAEVEETLDEVTTELDEVKNQIENLERELEAKFNDRVDEVLALLEYENVDGIRLERLDEEFRLRVSRETDRGKTVRDTVDTLSESEREVVGMVTALTGYLVHDIGDISPVIVLDSVEMIDSARIARLLDYVEERTDYLVAALLPAHSRHLDSVKGTVNTVEYPRT
ncbi:archaea-specific SMC-related protein [Halobaculum roseum]|uniref:Archaea-specific SMC-related protein n=1 Tax=Halobaculum roseum TaxID=2175149 RepID=A0ABD5MUC2_9EURY|nr:archaea-specific SMC-related protein [Halobaculum roseum]QZY01959.1 AAA family ATPase [Halobaculum roseum]